MRCPKCGGQLRALDVKKGAALVLRTFECTACGRAWQSEEKITAPAVKRWLRQKRRTAGGKS